MLIHYKVISFFRLYLNTLIYFHRILNTYKVFDEFSAIKLYIFILLHIITINQSSFESFIWNYMARKLAQSLIPSIQLLNIEKMKNKVFLYPSHYSVQSFERTKICFKHFFLISY